MSNTALASSPMSATFTASEYLPIAVWGSDHWSLFLYVDSVMTDMSGFEVGTDARMRSNRHNLRAMAKNPKPLRAKNTSAMAVLMPAGAGTPLVDGSRVPDHDDWSCLQDMASVGVFTVAAAAVEPGVTLKFSKEGRAIANQVRQFKQDGGNFAEFRLAMIPADIIAALKSPHYEVFELLNLAIDVAAIQQDIDDGVLVLTPQELPREFVQVYGEKALALDPEKPGTRMVFGVIGVDVPRAMALPESVLKKPLFVADVGPGKGMFSLTGGPMRHLLIDGQHRVTRAYYDKTETLLAYVIPQAKLRKYKV